VSDIKDVARWTAIFHRLIESQYVYCCSFTNLMLSSGQLLLLCSRQLKKLIR